MTRVIRSRRAGLSRDQSRQQPLYARLLGLQYLTPSGFLCFLFLEGALALGALLALAELVSWWGVLVLPVTVAAMVKLNDVVAGSVSRPAVPAARTAGGPPAGAGAVRTSGSGRGTGGRVGREIGLRAAAGTATGFDDFLDGPDATRPLPAFSSPAIPGAAVRPATMGAPAPEGLTPEHLTAGVLPPGAPAPGSLTAGAAEPAAGTSGDRPLEPWMPTSWMRENRPSETAPDDPWKPDPWTPEPSAAEQASPESSTPHPAAGDTWQPETWAPPTWTPQSWGPQNWTPQNRASDPRSPEAQRAVIRTRSSMPAANAADASALNGPPAARQWASRAEQLDDPQQLARQAASRRYE